MLISNGSNILKIGSCTACYKTSEAVLIYRDEKKERNEPS